MLIAALLSTVCASIAKWGTLNTRPQKGALTTCPTVAQRSVSWLPFWAAATFVLDAMTLLRTGARTSFDPLLLLLLLLRVATRVAWRAVWAFTGKYITTF